MSPELPKFSLLVILAVFSTQLAESNANVIVPYGGTKEAKFIVGRFLLEELDDQLLHLTEWLNSTHIDNCPTGVNHGRNRVSVSLQDIVELAEVVKQESADILTAHYDKVTRSHWRVVIQKAQENLEKLNTWIEGVPSSPCLMHTAAEGFLVGFHGLHGKLRASLDLLKELKPELTTDKDYRVGFIAVYRDYTAALVTTMQKMKNEDTIVSAVSDNNYSPAYDRSLQSVTEYLKTDHSTLIEHTKSTVTAFLVSESTALNSVIEATKTSAQRALTLARELKEKCTDMDMGESDFASLIELDAKLKTYHDLMTQLEGGHIILRHESAMKANPLTIVIGELENAWANARDGTRNVLNRCIMQTTMDDYAEEDDC